MDTLLNLIKNRIESYFKSKITRKALADWAHSIFIESLDNNKILEINYICSMPFLLNLSIQYCDEMVSDEVLKEYLLILEGEEPLTYSFCLKIPEHPIDSEEMKIISFIKQYSENMEKDELDYDVIENKIELLENKKVTVIQDILIRNIWYLIDGLPNNIQDTEVSLNTIYVDVSELTTTLIMSKIQKNIRALRGSEVLFVTIAYQDGTPLLSVL